MKIIYVKSCADCPYAKDSYCLPGLKYRYPSNSISNDCPLDDADLAEVIYKLASMDDESRPTPAGADSANACPKCGCEQTMPTGDGNAIGLCGHVWQAKN